MHGGQVISIFIFFSKYPFGGISYTLPLLGFQFRFFCLFTQTQPHKNQSDPNKIFVFFIFQYTLICIQDKRYLDKCQYESWYKGSLHKKKPEIYWSFANMGVPPPPLGGLVISGFFLGYFLSFSETLK